MNWAVWFSVVMMNMVPERFAAHSERSSTISWSCRSTSGSSVTSGDRPGGLRHVVWHSEWPSAGGTAVVHRVSAGMSPDVPARPGRLRPGRGQSCHGHLDARAQPVDGSGPPADLLRATHLRDGRLEVPAADLVRDPGKAPNRPG